METIGLSAARAASATTEASPPVRRGVVDSYVLVACGRLAGSPSKRRGHGGSIRPRLAPPHARRAGDSSGSRAERHVPGELAPRSATLPRPEQNARAVARLIPWFSSVVPPAIAVMSAVGSMVLRILRIEPAGTLDQTHSTERMRLAVASREMRLGEHAARRLVGRALRFPEAKSRHARRDRRAHHAGRRG
jgi:Cyclin M transmembrane N-terminal domain